MLFRRWFLQELIPPLRRLLAACGNWPWIRPCNKSFTTCSLLKTSVQIPSLTVITWWRSCTRATECARWSGAACSMLLLRIWLLKVFTLFSIFSNFSFRLQILKRWFSGLQSHGCLLLWALLSGMTWLLVYFLPKIVGSLQIQARKISRRKWRVQKERKLDALFHWQTILSRSNLSQLGGVPFYEKSYQVTSTLLCKK